MPVTTLHHHLARLVAGAAAASAVALLGAAAADAATPVRVTKTGLVLVVKGSDGRESVLVSPAGGGVLVSNTLGPVQAGTGCVQLGTAVRCDGVIKILYSGSSGDDSFRNGTSLESGGNGGPGDDRYTGGPGVDSYRGDAGTDVVDAGGGVDYCNAETESACELDFPPPPKVRRP